MNIYPLHKDPNISAQMLDDATLAMHPIQLYSILQEEDFRCTSMGRWLELYAVACCAEYAFRHHKVHNAYRALTDLFIASMDKPVIVATWPSAFSVEEQRDMYIRHLDCTSQARWSHRNPPKFLENAQKSVYKP